MSLHHPPAPSAPRKKFRNLAQNVVAHVTDGINEGSLRSGDKLPPELEIMRIHGVSRAVVREAISHMKAAGLVETRHGVGTFVLEPQPSPLPQQQGLEPNTVLSMRDMLEILELRISLESESAGLTAVRRSDTQLAQLRRILDTFQDCVARGADTEQPDTEFHLLIAQASGNRYFYDMLCHLGANIISHARVTAAKEAQTDPVAYMERASREHEDIVNAIARQDAESARAAMRTHLSNSRERLRQAMEATEMR